MCAFLKNTMHLGFEENNSAFYHSVLFLEWLLAGEWCVYIAWILNVAIPCPCVENEISGYRVLMKVEDPGCDWFSPNNCISPGGVKKRRLLIT